MSKKLRTFAKEANKSVSSEENTELVKRENINGTPFVVVTVEKKSFGTIGVFKVTPEFENEEDVIEYIEQDGWELRIAIMQAMITGNQVEQKGKQLNK